MRALSAIVVILLSAAPALAGPISQDDAVSAARSAGFSLVSKTEAVPGGWDIWASKDGIPYEVKINATDGSLVNAIPLEDND